jgi:hypothetical protein
MDKIQKPVGVWLDFREALIVYLDEGKVSSSRLNSGIDDSHPVGGSGTSTPYGAQEAVSETKYLHRRQQQEKLYYQSIIEKLTSRDAVYILGPAQAKIGLEQEMKKQIKLGQKIKAVQSCDRITDNQICARVRDFFLNEN